MSDAERLKRLYLERVPTGMSQAEFGAQYGIGTKAMVWQYLTGYRPLNFEAAAKFARGLRCTIADISPEMARRLKNEIFPVLGKVSLKAAVLISLLIPPSMQNNAHASFNITFSQYTLPLKGLLRRLRELVRKCAFTHRFSSPWQHYVTL